MLFNVCFESWNEMNSKDEYEHPTKSWNCNLLFLWSWTFFKPQSCNHTFGGEQKTINSISNKSRGKCFFYLELLDWITMQVPFFMMTCHLNVMNYIWALLWIDKEVTLAEHCRNKKDFPHIFSLFSKNAKL